MSQAKREHFGLFLIVAALPPLNYLLACSALGYVGCDDRMDCAAVVIAAIAWAALATLGYAALMWHMIGLKMYSHFIVAALAVIPSLGLATLATLPMKNWGEYVWEQGSIAPRSERILDLIARPGETPTIIDGYIFKEVKISSEGTFLYTRGANLFVGRSGLFVPRPGAMTMTKEVDGDDAPSGTQASRRFSFSRAYRFRASSIRGFYWFTEE